MWQTTAYLEHTHTNGPGSFVSLRPPSCSPRSDSLPSRSPRLLPWPGSSFKSKSVMLNRATIYTTLSFVKYYWTASNYSAVAYIGQVDPGWMNWADTTSLLSLKPPTVVLSEPAAGKCQQRVFFFSYHLNLSEQAKVKITMSCFYWWLSLVWLPLSLVLSSKLWLRKGITDNFTGSVRENWTQEILISVSVSIGCTRDGVLVLVKAELIFF